MMKQTVLALLMSTALVSHAAPEAKGCQSTEERLSAVSIKLVEAYASTDYDKAGQIAKASSEELDRSIKMAKDCGCPGAVGPSMGVKAAIAMALEENDFSQLRLGLQEAVTKAEAARGVVESCWREAVATQRAKK